MRLSIRIDNVIAIGLNRAFQFIGRLKVKVRASVKKICNKCRVFRRGGIVRVACEDPRHKQRQG